MYHFIVNKNLSLVTNKYKELPNNIEAEQAVIGSILTDNEIFDDISIIISSKNFYDFALSFYFPVSHISFRYGYLLDSQ